MNLEELGFYAVSKGDCQEAVNIFRRALEKKRDANGFLGLATAYWKLGDDATARWAFRKALELDAQNEQALGALRQMDLNPVHRPGGTRGAAFRTAKDCFEVQDLGQWSKMFIMGINIGLGLPGHFPGEFPAGRTTYVKWLNQIADLGVNAVRIYTVHPPSFYEALCQVNESGKRLYLFQGIWAELPGKNDFYDDRYLAAIRENIRQAVDVVYGNADVEEMPGSASGAFRCDVSSWTAGFIFGREWESCAVKGFNESRGRKQEDFPGPFFSISRGTPFEVWITKACDFLGSYEFEKYGLSHPVSAVNWPTLDPLDHPSELLYSSSQVCSENEDMESLDFSKITARRGNGIFATYHAYPYYPDFINNEHADEENPYLAYLRDLKRHHGDQPVLIGEFGVPSSRDASHWQRNGWHHGGHSEAQQGEINGLLMKSIREARMAGGVLFSWFDEWFKRSWVFSPYEIPADRTPLWFSSQDAEKNYGLLAAYPGYPGKLVTLSGRSKEWSTGKTLYEKRGSGPLYKFNDGFDDSRSLVRLIAQHDEGFLYLLLVVKGTADFSQAHYLIGLDTCCSDAGEVLLPFQTKLFCPVGLKFVIHVAGESKSRILACKSYDKYLNVESGEIKPAASDQGEWVMMQNRTNYRRTSRDGSTFYPSRVFTMSNLKCGSLDPEDPRYNSTSDFSVHENMIELRIPWSLINMTDPSSRMVLWMDRNGKTKKTEGIKILAASYKPRQGSLCAADTGGTHNMTDTLPERMMRETIRQYTWEEYDTPVYHTYLKDSYKIYKEILSRIQETPWA